MTVPQALVKLSRSKFRGRFKLDEAMRGVVMANGMDTIREFAKTRIAQALAPAEPERDGHQTPLKGHPVFLAQHATATCCRNCLNHWWRVPKGVAMTESQQERVVNLIMAWIDMQMKGGIEVLKAGMSAEELATIPFWQQQGARFACPYRANG